MLKLYLNLLKGNISIEYNRYESTHTFIIICCGIRGWTFNTPKGMFCRKHISHITLLESLITLPALLDVFFLLIIYLEFRYNIKNRFNSDGHWDVIK